MLISVVIPTHARPQALARLLASLADQNIASDLFEVLVVANLEHDDSRQVVEKFRHRISQIGWSFVGAKGVNRARNQGLKKVKTPIALLLDDDCYLPHRDFLNHVLEAHRRNPSVVAIGGNYIVPSEASNLERAYNFISTRWLNRVASDGGHTVNLVGGNVSYKVEKIRQLQIEFDNSIIFGGSETDFHMRLIQAGEALSYLPDLNVEHRAELSGISLLKKAFLQGVGFQRRRAKGLWVATSQKTFEQFDIQKRAVRKWVDRFDAMFELGRHFVEIEPSGNPTRSRLLRFFAVWGLDSAKRRTHRFLLGGFRFWLYFASLKKMKMAPALNRFYVLPFSKTCRHDCDYCPALGLRKVAEDFDPAYELQRAKRYGFREVLLPCNVFDDGKMDPILREVRRHGLQPVVLVNGDSSAPIESSRIETAMRWGASVHLLLGVPSTYQRSLIRFLSDRTDDFSASVFCLNFHKAFSAVKNAPRSLIDRIHFLFPSMGDLWHPSPSCAQIQTFLVRLYRRWRRHGGGLVVRSSAGYWPLDRGLVSNREVWPLLSPEFSTGAHNDRCLFSVIIPAFNSAEYLKKVLTALDQQDISSDEYEVLILDDGSVDNSRETIRMFVETRLRPSFYFRYFYWPRPAEALTAELPHFRAGLIRNVGVSHANGENLCFLDADILVPSNYFSRLKENLLDNDVVQMRREMLTAEASERPFTTTAFSEQDCYKDDRYWEDFKAFECWALVPKFWKYTCTYALTVKREFFEKAEWFAVDFFSYGFEDVDLGYRMAGLGARFLLSQNSVYHLYPARRQLNYHFDPNERNRMLTLSSRVFYRLRLDPEIYREFYPSYYQPLTGELKIFGGQAWGVFRRLIGWGQIFWGVVIYRALGESYRISIVAKWWLWERVLVPILKPYYFLKYQWVKRVADADPAEQSLKRRDI